MQVRGSLAISRDGVLADGIVTSSIEPERVLDGRANFQAFIPFREGAGEAFASVKGKWLCRWRSCQPTLGHRSARPAMNCAAGWPRRLHLVN